MHLAQALQVQVSLRLKLPFLSYILLKRKFIRQASVVVVVVVVVVLELLLLLLLLLFLLF